MAKDRPKSSSKSRKDNKPQFTQKSVVRPSSFWKQDKHLWYIGAILLITFLGFSPSLQNEFVNWDDDRNFYENQLVTEINADNFWQHTREIFSTDVIGNYNPLTIWTFAIESRVFGLDNPMPWHLTNILLHLICVLLVYRLCFLLGLGKWGSLLTTLLFALHPMRVESVTWVTERKDVLFGAFFLGALVLYTRGKQEGYPKRTVWIYILFILSLLSKIQAVTLPLSMLAIDYLMDKKISWSNVWAKLPYFALSLFFGVLGVLVLDDQGSLETNAEFNFVQRLFIGSYSFIVYLIKVLIPYKLSPLYPYPQSLSIWHYVSMIALPATLGFLYFGYKKGWKVPVFGMLFFIVNVFFLLQILGAGQGYLADRFTYIPYFGLFFIGGWAIDQWQTAKPSAQKLLPGILGLVALGYGLMTYQQTKVWENSNTLWTHVIKYHKNATLPYGNRANYLRDQGDIQGALADYSKTISLKDSQPEAYNSRAKLYFNATKNNRDTLILALNDYNKAIEYNNAKGEFYVNRGATYARLGDIDRAIADMNKGIELTPTHAVGYLNRSVMYHQKGDLANALKDIEAYLQLIPTNADMWYEKARTMRQLSQEAASIEAFNKAIRLNPNKAIYYYERARTYGFLNQNELAKQDLRIAIEMGYTAIDPNFRAMMGL